MIKGNFTLQSRPVQQMKKKEIIIDVICILFILLFTYAAVSKLVDREKFALQLTKSPLLTGVADLTSWSIPMIEIVISVLLIPDSSRKIGLYASYTLILIFSWYIIAILQFSECLGGIQHSVIDFSV